jgi:magnesium transporter
MDVSSCQRSSSTKSCRRCRRGHDVTNEFALCQAFIDAHAEEAARAIERLSTSEAAALIGAMPSSAARAVALITPTVAAHCLARLAPDAAAVILTEVGLGRAAILLRHLDDATKAAIFEQMSPDDVRSLRATLAYPAGSAGALMDSQLFVAIGRLRISDALAAARRAPRYVHDYVFVVNDEHRLIGVVGLRDLVSARPTAPVASVMNQSVSPLPASAAPAAILNHRGWTRFHTLPVVDDTSVFLGAISHVTVRRLFEEDARGRSSGTDAVTTVFALGELYWLGLSGVLDGVASAVRLGLPRVGRTREVTRGVE